MKFGSVERLVPISLQRQTFHEFLAALRIDRGKPSMKFGCGQRFLRCCLDREGVNREKLTVKKIINKEMFFSPFMSLTNREKSA